MRTCPSPGCVAVGLVLALLAGTGCAAAPGPREPDLAIEALPCRNFAFRAHEGDSMSPLEVLRGFLSGLDPRVVGRRGDGEILLDRTDPGGEGSSYPLLLRWKAAPPGSGWDEGSLLVEVTAVQGVDDSDAVTLGGGLVAWMRIHGIGTLRGIPTGIRIRPDMGPIDRSMKAVGAVMKEMGLEWKEGESTEGLLAAWNGYGPHDGNAEWFVFDAYDDPRGLYELAVLHPAVPFAAEEEREVLKRILHRILPDRDEEIADALR